jgi:HlyD family secretion protein
MKKKIIIILSIVIVLLAIVFVNIKKSGSKGTTVQTDKVKKQSVTQTVTASGKIQPQTEVKVSANVSGKIIRLGVKEGDRVKKGQFLVELDKARYEADVQQAEANLLSAKAGESKAKADFDRVTELFNKGLASKSELDIANAGYQTAVAQVAQAQALLDRAEDALSKTTIYSPMDGTITKLNSETGEIVRGSEFQSDVIMVVADLSSMEVQAEVDENDVVYISLGDTAKVEIDALTGQFFKGKVTEIANSAKTKGLGTQEEITNFDVKILLQNVNQKLRPGMSATVDVATETHKNVITVPIQAVTEREPKRLEKKDKNPETGGTAVAEDTILDDEPVPVVFVVENGIAKMRRVKTGISDDTYIEIPEGLKEGEEIVIGSFRVLSKELKDGDKVKVDNTALKIQKKKKEKQQTASQGEDWD